MDLSICILTRNQGEFLRQCVASCVREVQRTGVPSEIIVIDNASSDGSPQRVANLFATVRIIRNEENLGFAAANNKAIRLSRGRFVLILNDDAVLQEGSLSLMLRKLDSSRHIGAVGPKLLNPDGSLQRGFTNRRFPCFRGLLCGFLGLNPLLEKNALTRDLFTHSRDPELSGETDHVAGACLLARREALDAVGLFDEGFYYFVEDADLCHRLKKAEWKIVYLAEARVTHYGSASFKKLMWSERRAIHFTSLMYFFEKHSNPAKCFLLRLGLGMALFLQMPMVILFAMSRKGSARREWGRSVRTYLKSVRSLLIERH